MENFDLSLRKETFASFSWKLCRTKRNKFRFQYVVISRESDELAKKTNSPFEDVMESDLIM